jgi:hypothetical protein
VLVGLSQVDLDEMTQLVIESAAQPVCAIRRNTGERALGALAVSELWLPEDFLNIWMAVIS